MNSSSLGGVHGKLSFSECIFFALDLCPVHYSAETKKAVLHDDARHHHALLTQNHVFYRELQLCFVNINFQNNLRFQFLTATYVMVAPVQSG